MHRTWAAFCLVAFMSCGGEKSAAPSDATQQSAKAETATAAASNQPVHIGFSMDTLKEERWQRDKQLVEQRARELGATIDVRVANGDDAAQKRQCEEMLAKGINVLIIAPHNAEAAAEIVTAAHAKGVPVISYERLVRNAPVDLYVAHATEKIGHMQAQYALSRAPKGNYVLIGGAPTDYNAVLLRSGQMKELKSAVERGDIKIVSLEYAKEWLPEEARRITAEALKKTRNNIQAIVASNDGTAGGAVQALEQARVTSPVVVTGQDAEKAALQRIVAGKQTMTVYKSIRDLANAAVDAAMKLARKQPLKESLRMRNGSTEVRAILLDPVSVDQRNIDATVIKDGYHRREDIFPSASQ